MLFPGLNHLLVIPGCIMLALTGFNLLRSRKWRRTTGIIVERKTLPGEVIEDRIQVAYHVLDQYYISELMQSFGLPRHRGRVNDSVEILCDPTNPRKCMAYDPAGNILALFLAAVMILA